MAVFNPLVVSSGQVQQMQAGDTLNPAAMCPVPLTAKAPAVAVVVTAGYSARVPDEYECVFGVETEIGLGATVEIG